jgi:hypothetical protein
MGGSARVPAEEMRGCEGRGVLRRLPLRELEVDSLTLWFDSEQGGFVGRFSAS